MNCKTTLPREKKKGRSEFVAPRWTFKNTTVKVFWDKLQITSALYFLFSLPHAAVSLADGEFAVDLIRNNQTLTAKNSPSECIL